MTEPLQQETGVPSCQALDVAVDVDLSECTEPSYFDSDKPRVLAEYTSPTNQKTSLALPWNTGDFLEVRDDLNQVFHVATANGGLSYFSVVTEAGVEVLYNATIPEDQAPPDSSTPLKLHLTDPLSITGLQAEASTPELPSSSSSIAEVPTNLPVNSAVDKAHPPKRQKQTCYKCRRTFASQKQLRIHATSCAWCVSCSRWADELHVLTCKYGEEQFASTKRPTLARLLCNHCGKFTHRNYMQKHLSRKHSVQPESWRRCEHPEVLSEDEATTEQRQASVNIRRKCQIWSASAATFSEDDHRAIAQLLIAQTEAYLSFKDVASDLKAEAKTALAQAQKTLRDEKANLQAFIATSLILNKTVKSLSRLPSATAT